MGDIKNQKVAGSSDTSVRTPPEAEGKDAPHADEFNSEEHPAAAVDHYDPKARPSAPSSNIKPAGILAAASPAQKRDALIEESVALIRPGQNELSTTQRLKEGRDILNCALKLLIAHFKAKDKLLGKKPSEDEIKKSLGAAVKHIHKEYETDGFLDPSDLEKIFSDLVQNHASELGLVGTKDKSSATKVSSSPKPRSEAHSSDEIWQMHYQKLPQKTDDGRKFVPYNGTGMKEFINEIILHMFIVTSDETRKDDIEKFKEDFRIGTGVTFDTVIEWGSTRKPPTEQGRINTVWLELVDYEFNNGVIEKFIERHRPKDKPIEDWRALIAAAKEKSPEALRSFAIGLEHNKISQEDWTLYTGYQIKENHLEDITVEPLSIESMFKVYEYLNNYLRDHPKDKEIWAIDIYDFLASIYPLVQEMLLSSENGIINLVVPTKIIPTLDISKMGYGGFATALILQKIRTPVPMGTLYSHASEKTARPEYSTIRDHYVKPIATSAKLERDDERKLYLLLAGLFRMIPVLRDGGLLQANGKKPADTRYATELTGDQTINPSTGQRVKKSKLQIQVEHNYYEDLLELAEKQIGALELLSNPDGITEFEIIAADKRILNILELKARLNEFKSQMAAHRNVILNPNKDDKSSIVAAEKFYGELKEDAEDIIFYTQGKGIMHSEMGELPFATAVRGQQIHNGKMAVLYINDIIQLKNDGWSDERILNLIKMRVFVGHAIIQRDISKDRFADSDTVASAAKKFWPVADIDSLQHAADDYVTIETTAEDLSAPASRPIDLANREQRQREFLTKPPAPSKKQIAKWKEKWLAYAEKAGLDTGKIGVTRDTEKMEALLAQQAIDKYKQWVPRKSGSTHTTPVHRDALQHFVELECKPYKEIDTERVLAIAIISILTENNHTVHQATPEQKETRLPLQGMLHQEFHAFLEKWDGEEVNSKLVWNALFIPDLRNQLDNFDADQPIDPEIVGKALKQASSHGSHACAGDEKFLNAFIEHERNKLNTWKNLVAHSESGFTAHVFAPDRYNTRHLSRDGLAAMAEKYAAAKLFSTADLDPSQIVVSALKHGEMLPQNVIDELAGSLNTLLYEWINETLAAHTRAINSVYEGLEVAVLDLQALENTDKLIASAASIAGTTLSPVELEKTEKELELLQNILEKPKDGHTQKTIRQRAEYLLHSNEAESVRQMHAEKMLRLNSQLDELGKKAAGIAQRSADLYVNWKPVAETKLEETDEIVAAIIRSIESMDFLATSTFIGISEDRFADLAKLEKELAGMKNFPSEAKALVTSLDSEKTGNTTAKSIENDLALAKKYQENLSHVITETQSHANKHFNELERLKIIQVELESANKAITAAEKSAEELESALKDMDEIEKDVKGYETNSQTTLKMFNDAKGNVDKFIDAHQFMNRFDYLKHGLVERIEKFSQLIMRLLIGPSNNPVIPSAMDALRKLEDTPLQNMDSAVRELADKAMIAVADQTLKAQTASENSARLINRVSTAYKTMSDTLDKAEKILPIEAEAQWPARLPMEENSDSDWQFVDKVSNKDFHMSAKSILDPRFNGGIISMSLKRESRIVNQNDARRFERWIANKRTEIFSGIDIFGRTFEISAGEYGIRFIKCEDVSPQSTLRRIKAAFAKAMDKNSNEARLICLLLKSDGSRALLNDLFLEIASAEESVQTSDEFRGAIRAWAMIHREKICAVLSAEGAAKIFEDVNPQKSTPSNEPLKLYPDNFSATCKKRAEMYETLLCHPELMKVSILRANGDVFSAWVDSESFKDLIDFSSLTPGTNLRLEENEKFAGLKLFNLETKKYEDVPNLEIKAISVNNSAFIHPVNLRFNRLMYEIYTDPKLMNLAWIIGCSNFKDETKLKNFINDLLLPIARTREGAVPPYTLEDAQKVAVDVYKRIRTEPKILDIFIEPDSVLIKDFPELATVGAIAKLDAYKRISKSHVSKLQFEVSLEFAGAWALIDELALFGEFSPEENQGYRREIAEIAQQTALEVSDMERNGSDVKQIKKRLREGIRKIYQRHAMQIRKLLKEEKSTGFTRGRAITGLDNSEDGEETWKPYTPFQKLEITAPVVSRVKDLGPKNLKEYLSTSDVHNEPMVENLLSLIDRCPALYKAVTVLCAAATHFPEKYKILWAKFLNEAKSKSNDELVPSFVDFFTAPHILREIFAGLMMPASSMPEITVLEAISGSSIPPYLSKTANAPAPNALDNHANYVKTTNGLLADPRLAFVEIYRLIPKGNEQIQIGSGYVRNREFHEIIKKAKVSKSKKIAIELFSNGEWIKFDILNDGLTQIELAKPLIQDNLMNLRSLRLMHYIFSNPELRDFSRLLSLRFIKTDQILLKNFVNSLLDPIARLPNEKISPLIISEAQTVARKILLLIEQPDSTELNMEALWLFAEQDRQLAEMHPETGTEMISATQKINITNGFLDNKANIIGKAMRAFPEFNNALCIMAMAVALSDDDGSQSDAPLTNMLYKLTQLVDEHEKAEANAKIQNKKLEKESFRSRFRDIYHEYADTNGPIQTSLSKKLGPEMPDITAALRLTGYKEPWKGEVNFTDLPPLKLLSETAPIFGRILSEKTKLIFQVAKDSTVVSSSLQVTYAAMQRHPELANAFAVVCAAAIQMKKEDAKVWSAIYDKLSTPMSKEDAIELFVKTATTPEILHHIYEALQKPHPKDKSQTLTQFLTGNPTAPWLPVFGKEAGIGPHGGKGSAQQPPVNPIPAASPAATPAPAPAAPAPATPPDTPSAAPYSISSLIAQGIGTTPTVPDSELTQLDLPSAPDYAMITGGCTAAAGLAMAPQIPFMPMMLH